MSDSPSGTTPEPELDAALHRELTRTGLVKPVGPSHDEYRRWYGFDLASIVEGCFRQQIDVDALDENRWCEWRGRVGDWFSILTYDQLLRAQAGSGHFWLIHDGEHVGTLKLNRPWQGSPFLEVAALYVAPGYRRCGLATRVLQAAASAALQVGLLGVQLGTGWTWQGSLRFYLGRGFWVRHWRHDLRLVLQPQGPQWRFSVAGSEASFELVDQGVVTRCFDASQQGERLSYRKMELELPPELRTRALATFAVLLALAGWPLVRSEMTWAERYASADVGEPEGLAYKIGVFEETARESGWLVDTPRIPGLERWRAWAHGEEWGRDQEAMRSLRIVLHARGWWTQDLEERIRRLDPWDLDRLLRAGVTAATREVWLERLEASTWT